MLTKEMLKEFEGLEREIQDINKRIELLNKKENTVTIDSVQGSSKHFPYTKHNIVIQGIPFKNKDNKRKYNKMLKSKKLKLEKLKLQIEYELNYIKDPDIRRIIRLRYHDQKTWLQIMFDMGYNSESAARTKIERFLKNI